MKTAVEIALEKAQKNKEEEQRRRDIVERERVWREQEKKRLVDIIDKTIEEFKKLGFTSSNNKLYKGKTQVASLWIEWETSTIRYSDDSDEVDNSGFRIFWEVKDNWTKRDCTSNEQYFYERFGEAMAKWINV